MPPFMEVHLFFDLLCDVYPYIPSPERGDVASVTLVYLVLFPPPYIPKDMLTSRSVSIS